MTTTSTFLTLSLIFSLHQDMRSPRFAYKTEESYPDGLEALAKHAFPLSHDLVRFIQKLTFMLDMICNKYKTNFVGIISLLLDNPGSSLYLPVANSVAYLAALIKVIWSDNKMQQSWKRNIHATSLLLAVISLRQNIMQCEDRHVENNVCLTQFTKYFLQCDWV